MNKYLIIIIIFFSSCSHLIETRNFEDKCNRFEIIVNNDDIERKLFNSILKNSLSEKFDILFKNSKVKNFDEKLCKLVVNVEEKSNPTLQNKSGNTSRVNKKIKVTYNLKGEGININKVFVIFYGSNVSEYIYSDHIKNKKEDINNINNIVDRIYFEIINN